MTLRAEETAERRNVRAPARRGGLAALVVAGLAGLAGCDPWVVGNGVFAESVRVVPAFQGLHAEYGLEVEVAAGAVGQAVRVSGDENVLQYVKTSVADDPTLGPTLVVRLTVHHLESTHPLRVTIDVGAFHHVEADEGARVSVENAAAESFSVRGSDGASVELAGRGGDHLSVNLTEGAQLDARSYVTGDAEVALDQGAAAHLHSDGAITGTVGGGAVLENAGEGACDVTVSGGGTLDCGP